MSDLVENPEDRFSLNEAHLYSLEPHYSNLYSKALAYRGRVYIIFIIAALKHSVGTC